MNNEALDLVDENSPDYGYDELINNLSLMLERDCRRFDRAFEEEREVK